MNFHEHWLLWQKETNNYLQCNLLNGGNLLRVPCTFGTLCHLETQGLIGEFLLLGLDFMTGSGVQNSFIVG